MCSAQTYIETEFRTEVCAIEKIVLSIRIRFAGKYIIAIIFAACLKREITFFIGLETWFEIKEIIVEILGFF